MLHWLHSPTIIASRPFTSYMDLKQHQVFQSWCSLSLYSQKTFLDQGVPFSGTLSIGRLDGILIAKGNRKPPPLRLELKHLPSHSSLMRGRTLSKHYPISWNSLYPVYGAFPCSGLSCVLSPFCYIDTDTAAWLADLIVKPGILGNLTSKIGVLKLALPEPDIAHRGRIMM